MGPALALGGVGALTAGGLLVREWRKRTRWGGSEHVATGAKKIAASMGLPVTSLKRTLADTQRVGSTTASDHYTGNTNAYAVDFAAEGAAGDALANAIARRYGIPARKIGTFESHTVKVGRGQYRLQLLWRTAGHFDHVHFGIRRVA